MGGTWVAGWLDDELLVGPAGAGLLRAHASMREVMLKPVTSTADRFKKLRRPIGRLSFFSDMWAWSFLLHSRLKRNLVDPFFA